MQEKSPAYLWYPKDVMSSGRVAALTDLEELWYRRALDQSWLHCGMPVDPAEFAGWVGRNCTAESAKRIIDKFFQEHKKYPGKVFNKKQEALRKELRRKSKERARAGIESGRKRRERSKLKAEQVLDSCSNKTQTKPNIPIAVPSSSSKDKEQDSATQAETAESSPVERRIWSDGVDLLKRDGHFEKASRALLGKLIQEYGKQPVAEAIAVTQAENPGDSKSFLVGVLHERSGKNGRVKSQLGKSGTKGDCDNCGNVRFVDEGSETVPCPECKAEDYQWVKSKSADSAAANIA